MSTIVGRVAAVLTVALAQALLSTSPLAAATFAAGVPALQNPDTETTARDSVQGDTTQGDTTGEEHVAPGSPRASLEQFLELSRQGRYDEAAAFLDLPDSLRAQGATKARQLAAVLDRYVWFDFREISPDNIGDTADGLPGRVEQVAELRGPDGKRQPVRLTRSQQDGEVRWLFSRATVGRIPGWYSTLSDRWLIEHLPAPLLRHGPLDLVWWQWLALPVLLVVAIGLGVLLSKLLRSAFGRLARRTSTEWDDAILARLGGPLTLLCTLLVIGAMLPLLGLYQPAAVWSYQVLRVGFLLVFFWAAWRMVDVGREIATHTLWARTSAASRALIPLGARVTKAIVIAFAAVAALSVLGYPVASLIAGLGLGGLAFALAAQKTVENLFGAFSIGVDQPFREGDFVKVEDFTGHVETIGLRSTRFRTADRTLITLPNGRLADMRVESFAARDRLRFATTIGLVYETTAEQMRQVLAGIERVLRAQPKIWPEGITVRFIELGASALNVEVAAWFQTTDVNEFQDTRQQMLLGFMEVIEQAGTAIAFPTSTVHVASMPMRDARQTPNGA